MASNPMQKKARNSFLLGMLLMLLIASVIIGLLFLQLSKMQKEEKARNASMRSAYVLNRDIKSGEEITSADLILKTVSIDTIPADFVTSDIVTKLSQQVQDNSNIQSEETAQKKVAKIDLTKGTVVSQNMIQDSDAKTTNDVRLQEFNMIDLPSDLQDNEYIDIRLVLPSGQDYIVVSKKCVKKSTEETMWLELREDEIVTMSNAIVEAYIMKGSRLYATRYVEPGMQTVATPTYPVSREVMALIEKNPNIEQEARNALYNRYNSNGQAEQRNNAINNAINQYSEEAKSNIETNIEEQITKSKAERKKYIESLNAAAAATTSGTATTTTSN